MEYLIIIYEGNRSLGVMPTISQRLTVNRRELFKFLQENATDIDVSFVVYELECVIDLS